MKISEFIKEVNKVAYAERDKCGQIRIYVNRAFSDCDWFLSLSPETKYIIAAKDWSCLSEFMTPRDLNRVLDLVQELQDTPVDERFPKKKYVLVAHPDSKRDFMTDALKYVSLIESTEDEFAFHYGPATIFSEDSLAAVAKAHPFIKPAIDAMKKEVD